MKTLEQMISELIDENAKLKLENFELRQEIKKLTEAKNVYEIKNS